jgi:hypothetical protein
MVETTTSWTVRTTKRKSPNSAPNPRKRQRSFEHLEDEPASIQRKSRQQTLTQIQFVPNRSQGDKDENLTPIATVPRRAPARQNGARLQKRNSTLTQMDFVATCTKDADQQNELTPICDGEGALIQLDGTRDTPRPRRQSGAPVTVESTSKRKATPIVPHESQEFWPTKKKRKADIKAKEETMEAGRQMPSRMASVKATRLIGLLSARHDDDDENRERSERPSIIWNAAAPSAQDQQPLPQKTSWPTSDQEGQHPSQREKFGALFLRTPSKKKNTIPSSQSPESLPPSTRKTDALNTGNRILRQERSPLKERSANVRLSRRGKDYGAFPLKLQQGPSPTKRKICALELPRHDPQQERTPVGDGMVVSKHTIWSPPSSSPPIAPSEKPPVVPMPDIKESIEGSEPKQPTKQLLQTPIPRSTESAEEDEPDILASSQLDHGRAPFSSAGAIEKQEILPSLRGLLGQRHMPEEATTFVGTDNHNQPYNQAGHLDVVVKDFSMVEEQRWAQTQNAGLNQDDPPTVGSPSSVFVADSQEGSVLALSPGSSIANDTQFNAELAERVPTLSADASPSPSASPTYRRSPSPSPRLDWEIGLSLPHPNLVHQPSTYSTTKTIPLNDTSSSPSLPSRFAQRTVCPASLPHPSQVSTQDPTQSYLPMSSMPLAPLSSPPKSGLTTITIKDSSSVPRPLREIPSQRHSQPKPQSQSPIELGVDDCLDAVDDEDLDQEQITMSDKAGRALEEQDEDSQVLPKRTHTTQGRSQYEARVKATEAGSPVRRRRPRKPVIPPEVRAVLGESLLESVPGPPGWSQRSWDDEPL